MSRSSYFCVSHTAPCLSAEEEARELHKIPHQEKREIYKDKYGRYPDESIPPSRNNRSIVRTIIGRNTVMGGLGDNYNVVHGTSEETRREVEEDSNDNEQEVNNVNVDRDEDEDEDEDEANNNGDDNNEGSEEDDDDDEDADITIEMVQSYFRELTEIPAEDKLDYMQALVECVHLVRDESDPVMFLRYCDYDPHRAAVAVCDYWKARVDIFKDDAFKPMTLGGAFKNMVTLIANDLRTFIRLLPPDDYGRHILCCDRTHLNYNEMANQMDVVKYTWYVFHRELVKTSIQKNGVVYLVISRGQTNFLKRKVLKHIYASKLPIKFVCGHFCMSSLASRVILPAMKLIVRPEHRKRMELHLSLKLPTIINELKEFGIQPENLPKSIGGSLTVANGDIPPWIADCESIINRKKKNSKLK